MSQPSSTSLINLYKYFTQRHPLLDDALIVVNFSLALALFVSKMIRTGASSLMHRLEARATQVIPDKSPSKSEARYVFLTVSPAELLVR